jgi:hypothetical protein
MTINLRSLTFVIFIVFQLGQTSVNFSR